ncbi:ribosomal protein L7Ae [Trichuris suis]|nr:ribosomal protein L7Ae [Trichuris suis]
MGRTKNDSSTTVKTETLDEVETGPEDCSVSLAGASDFTSRENYDQLCALVNEIASPLASRKLAKKLYKLLRKSSEHGKNYCIYGITAVQKALKRGATGLCVLAGDVSPIDTYCHIPAVCESKGMSYIYLPSKNHMGAAIGKNQPVMIVLIVVHEDYKDLYDETYERVSQLHGAIDEFNCVEDEEAKMAQLADATLQMAAKAIPGSELMECAASYAACLRAIVKISKSVTAQIRQDVLSHMLNNGREEYIAFKKVRKSLKNAVLDMDHERFKLAHLASTQAYYEPETKRASEQIFMIEKKALEMVMKELNPCMLRQKSYNKTFASCMTKYHATALDILYDFRLVTVSE